MSLAAVAVHCTRLLNFMGPNCLGWQIKRFSCSLVLTNSSEKQRTYKVAGWWRGLVFDWRSYHKIVSDYFMYTRIHLYRKFLQAEFWRVSIHFAVVQVSYGNCLNSKCASRFSAIQLLCSILISTQEPYKSKKLQTGSVRLFERTEKFCTDGKEKICFL